MESLDQKKVKNFNSVYRNHVVYGESCQSIVLKEFWNDFILNLSRPCSLSTRAKDLLTQELFLPFFKFVKSPVWVVFVCCLITVLLQRLLLFPLSCCSLYRSPSTISHSTRIDTAELTLLPCKPFLSPTCRNFLCCSFHEWSFSLMWGRKITKRRSFPLNMQIFCG